MTFAVIFDMDGVLIDNMPLHFKAWKEFFGKHEKACTDEEFDRHVPGKKNSDILPYFFGEISDEEMHALAMEKEEMYRDFARKELTPVKGLPDFLEELKKQGIVCAIATTAPPENADLCLDTLGIRKYFHTVVDETKVRFGKPDPQIFLLAAKEISYAPQQCIVIEDSFSGIKAARSAGMKVIGMTTTHREDEIPGADFYVEDFSELSVHRLAQMVFGP